MKVCYAKNGTYLFPVVQDKHLANLEYTLNNLLEWKVDMMEEILLKKDKIKWVRVHDGGDFYSEEYLNAWLKICKVFPNVIFYCYTKQVSLFKKVFKDNCPPNFKYLFSLGGREDGLIDLENDRHCDVFPSLESLVAAGYTDQSENDLLAITLPTNKIGIVANNIPQFLKLQGELTFKSGQEARMILRKGEM